MSYVYVAATVLLTVYGQIVIKWQVLNAGAFPETPAERVAFLARLFLNPWIVSGFVAALGAAVSWMAAMTKLPLSHAYPFTSLAFVLILLAGHYCFGESITPLKIAGVALVMLGIAVGSQG
jgi:multidrug transporter EmrE-like cation transporter